MPEATYGTYPVENIIRLFDEHCKYAILPRMLTPLPFGYSTNYQRWRDLPQSTFTNIGHGKTRETSSDEGPRCDDDKTHLKHLNNLKHKTHLKFVLNRFQGGNRVKHTAQLNCHDISETVPGESLAAHVATKHLRQGFTIEIIAIH